MLRPDKITLSLFENTLRTYIKGEEPLSVKMLKTSAEELKKRAERLRALVGGTVKEYSAPVGSGSAPGALLPGYALMLDVLHPEKFSELLRRGTPPVAVCVRKGKIIIAMRSVDDKDIPLLADRIKNALGRGDEG